MNDICRTMNDICRTMNDIAIYTLTSELHDEKAVGDVTKEFLGSLGIEYVFKGSDYGDYGSHALDVIYVRTGGTEGIFKRLLPQLQAKSDEPFYLLTSGKSNSLAASLEILSYLRLNGLQGEIVHGQADKVANKLRILAASGEAKRQLRGCKLGIIGAPSDWLIASYADKEIVKEKTGIELIEIPMKEVLESLPPAPSKRGGACDKCHNVAAVSEKVREALPGAYQIYEALKTVVEKHGLQGLTIRCFDLLTAVHNTGCMALAKLNAEGIVAGCEGDVPALLSMMISKVVTGVSGFQANPARIDTETGELLFAHCTIPLNMVERYELDSHFESGIGVGIRGYMAPGPVTIFKVSGDLSHSFIAEGELLRCEAKTDLCRTQMVIRLNNPAQASYFLTNPIGNHHIIVPGHQLEVLEKIINN